MAGLVSSPAMRTTFLQENGELAVVLKDSPNMPGHLARGLFYHIHRTVGLSQQPHQRWLEHHLYHRDLPF